MEAAESDISGSLGALKADDPTWPGTVTVQLILLAWLLPACAGHGRSFLQ